MTQQNYNMKVGDVSTRLGQKKLKQYMTRWRVCLRVKNCRSRHKSTTKYSNNLQKTLSDPFFNQARQLPLASIVKYMRYTTQRQNS